MWTNNIKIFMSAFLPVKFLKWPHVHINFVVICLCRININYLHMAFQCLFPEYINYYFIKNQTTWHYTSRTIVTYILLFWWIKNWMIFQYDILDEGKKSLPNSENINFWFFSSRLMATFQFRETFVNGKLVSFKPIPNP